MNKDNTHNQKIKLLSKSFEYTNFYSEFVSFNKKIFKIVVRHESGTPNNYITCVCYLVGNDKLSELFCNSDLKYNCANRRIEKLEAYPEQLVDIAKQCREKIIEIFG